MSTYKHGIEIEELQTPSSEPLEGTSGLQVVFGIAPVHLTADPSAAVNKPIKIEEFKEAEALLGYSDDWDTYPMCAHMFVSFKVFNISPVIYVNVLDPTKHTKDNTEKSVTVTNMQAVYQVDNVLLSSVTVKNDSAELKKDEDYIISMVNGYPVITLLSTGNAAEAKNLTISSKSIDPSKVMKEDIIGGYDALTGKETGMECLRQVYVMHQMVPGIILAPGWSHDPVVAAVIQEKTERINGVYETYAAIDIDTEQAKVYTKVEEVKEETGISSCNSVALWPMVSVNGKKTYYSTVWAAMTAYTDAQNGGRPYKSPSNEPIGITAAVLMDGTEVHLDTNQANVLNGAGIVTAINDDGWRSWGNNSACYPKNTDAKDRWICCRRMMIWYKEHFLRQYKEKVDDPYNPKLIENLVDSENMYLNGLTSTGYIAGGVISYSNNKEENTTADILKGWMIFLTRIAFWVPGEFVLDKLVFDPEILTQAITGGES